jgi:poly(A) polymerase
VGGYVRDRILGMSSKDIDIVVIGNGPDFALAFTHSKGLKAPAIYRRYGTAQFKIDEIEVEIVGARRESYSEEIIKPEVEVGTLTEDIYRRDFTINTLIVPLNPSMPHKIQDLTEFGLYDLEHKLIRTPTDPDKTFSDDPSRILRAIRFASKFGFNIIDETLNGIERNTLRLYKVPIEKVRDEINKILVHKNPVRAFLLMQQLGICRVIMPGFDLLFYIPQNPKYHYHNVGFHTLDVLGNIERPDLLTRLAAIFHDYGKIDHTRQDEKGEIISPHHEESRLPEIALRKLRYDNDTVAKVMLMIRMHMRLSSPTIGAKGIRKFIRDANGVLYELLDLIEADTKSHKELYTPEFQALLHTIRNYEQTTIREIQKIKSPLSGTDLISLLNYPAPKTLPQWNQIYGTRIGQIQQLLIDAIIAQNILPTREAATEFVLQLPREVLYPLS